MAMYMRPGRAVLSAVALGLLIGGCQHNKENGMAGTFGDDVRFLKQHTDLQVLTGSNGKALVAVSADLQGRVLTSSADGAEGLSYGWINRQLIASGENNLHINAYGGEDRFWLGPEGGQYSIFFAPGAPFDLEHWFTPPPINDQPYEIAESGDDFVVFAKDIQVGNYSRFAFSLKLRRQIRLLPEEEACRLLNVNVPNEVAMVAFQSENTITNTGPAPWQKRTGLLSIWILGMFNPSEATTVVVPYRPGPQEQLGPVVNDAYFGKVPADRLAVRDEAIYFSGDGRHRSKIGLTGRRARNLLGSYDARNQVLTLVSYNQPTGDADYVNSMWQLQEAPYAGDVVNSYNDGPAEPGAKPLGPFYELETSSPAVELPPDGSLTHIHRTFHFQGPAPQLDAIARATLGVGLDRIQNALK